MAPLNPFGQAIDLFIEHLRQTEDPRSLFYQELLQEAAKLKFQDGAREQISRSAQSLQTFIENLDEQQTRRGKTRWIGRKLQPLVAGLMQFTGAMDTMIQAGPAPAMLIYGGAKLVLSLAQNFAECFDKMVDAMHEIGTMLKCYHIFSDAYDSADLMRTVLLESYKNILVFWQKAARTFTRNGVKTFLKGVVKPFESEWKTLKTRLELDVRQVSTVAQALEGIAAKRREEEAKYREEAQDKHLQQTREQQIRLWLSGSDDIAQIDVRMDLEPIRKARHIGTCEWVFGDSEYRQWLTSTENANLWLYASPGTGKSVLCSAIIDRLQSENKKVVYFFFSFQESVKRSITAGLKSIALQLLGLHEVVPTDVERIFQSELRHGHTKLQNPDVILLVVQALLKSLPRIHIVLDGLDECEKREQAVDLLSKCFSMSSLGIVKWLWASRIDPKFQSLSSSAKGSSIYIQKSYVEADIKKFIEDNPEMAGNSEESIDEWVSASGGNFLWLRLMLRTLTGCDLTCPAEVEEELEKFPKDLAQCYQRVLDQVAKRSRSQQALARRLFLLIAFAEQPLTLHETLDALSIDEDSGDVSSNRRPYELLVKSLCCPLILLDPVITEGRPDFVLRYFHKSIRDFFREDPASLDITDHNKAFFATPEQGHLNMSKICMTYLSHKRYQDPTLVDPESATFVEEHGFMRYAALFWHRHFSCAGYSDNLFNSAEAFLKSANFWSCIRVQAIVAPYLFGRLISEGDISFLIIQPNYVDNNDKDYFATPLPDWFGNTNEGSTILQAYLAFIREWNPVLLLQPQAALQCHPGVLGSYNVFQTGGMNSPNDYIASLKLSCDPAEQSSGLSMMPPCAQILGVQTTKSGVRLFSIERPAESQLGGFFLKQWHANLDTRSSDGSIEIKQKRVWDVRTSYKLPFLQLRSDEKLHEPAVWSLDPKTLDLSVHRAGKDVHFDPPSDIYQSWKRMSNSVSSGHRKIHGIRQRQHHNGRQLVICIVWKLGLHTTGSETDNDSDDSDSDVSDDRSDSNGSEPSSRSGTYRESGNQHYFGLIIALDGVKDPVWSSWESKSAFVTDLIPSRNSRNSLLAWPISKSLVQYVCPTSGMSRHLSLPLADEREILLRGENRAIDW